MTHCYGQGCGFDLSDGVQVSSHGLCSGGPLSPQNPRTMATHAPGLCHAIYGLVPGSCSPCAGADSAQLALGACSKLLLTQVPLACVPSMSWLSWLRALRQGWLHCGADEIAMAEGMESTGLAGSLARQTLVPEGLGLGYEQVGTRQLRSFSSILMGHF